MHHTHGIATTADLEAAGISRGRLRGMPEYERMAQGHYALPGARRDFWLWAALALSIAGEDGRLTSDSALYVHRIVDQPPLLVRVVVPEGKGSRKERDFDVRRSSHLPVDVATKHRLRTADVAYAITDYGRDATDAALALAISRALGKRLTTLAAIEAIADERGSFPGSRRLRRVLEDFDGKATHSKRERLLRRELVRLGVPIHPEPLPIRDGSGRVIREADIAIPDVLLDVEVDGPHHFDPRQQDADRRHDRQMAAISWAVVRYTIYEIDDDVARVAREIHRLYQQRLGTANAG